MAIKKSELYSSLWASCDELRGGMDASEYKDYVLLMLFIKYISKGRPPSEMTSIRKSMVQLNRLTNLWVLSKLILIILKSWVPVMKRLNV